jgi:hypothetical protein
MTLTGLKMLDRSTKSMSILLMHSRRFMKILRRARHHLRYLVFSPPLEFPRGVPGTLADSPQGWLNFRWSQGTLNGASQGLLSSLPETHPSFSTIPCEARGEAR